MNDNFYKLKELFNREKEIKTMDASFSKLLDSMYHRRYWMDTCYDLLDRLEKKRLFILKLEGREKFYNSLEKSYKDILYQNLHKGVSLNILSEKYGFSLRTLFRRLTSINQALSNID